MKFVRDERRPSPWGIVVPPADRKAAKESKREALDSPEPPARPAEE